MEKRIRLMAVLIQELRIEAHDKILIILNTDYARKIEVGGYEKPIHRNVEAFFAEYLLIVRVLHERLAVYNLTKRLLVEVAPCNPTIRESILHADYLRGYKVSILWNLRSCAHCLNQALLQRIWHRILCCNGFAIESELAFLIHERHHTCQDCLIQFEFLPNRIKLISMLPMQLKGKLCRIVISHISDTRGPILIERRNHGHIHVSIWIVTERL